MIDDKQQVLDLERRRCAAIGTGDLAALADVLADDYVHVMGTGKVKDKAAYIETIRNGPRAPERGDLTVRVYGDAAVVTGDLLNSINTSGREPRTIDTMVTQVAVRSGGRWHFVSFQITPKRDSV
jgi:ketosteroid isomerase-like protein